MGRVKNLNMSYIPIDENVKKGDLIVTSPESDIFPQGLVVGHVSSVKNVQGAFHKTIKVEPFIKYNKIEIVFVIKKTPSEYVRRLEGTQ
jgi:rod shape-determining protein MreC